MATFEIRHRRLLSTPLHRLHSTTSSLFFQRAPGFLLNTQLTHLSGKIIRARDESSRRTAPTLVGNHRRFKRLPRVPIVGHSHVRDIHSKRD